MTDRAIQVGDLVQVVRWSCCGIEIGKVFQVASMHHHDNSWHCCTCRAPVPAGMFALDAQNRCGAILPWLKRIPPLSELEGTKTDEPIQEPA